MFFRITFVVALVTTAVVFDRDARSQDETPPAVLDIPKPANFYVEGIVRERKKYSFVIKGPDQDYNVRLSARTEILARLPGPNLDWKKRTVGYVIPMSSPTGRSTDNQRVEFKIAARAFVRKKFKTDAERVTTTRREPFEILEPIISQSKSLTTSYGNNDSLELIGEIEPTSTPGIFELAIESKKHRARLGNKLVRLDGFSIVDLLPVETEVFVNGFRDGSDIEATHIEFVRVGDSLRTESNSSLPRVLVVGDTVSFNYFKQLKSSLKGFANVHHPPANCRGTDSHTKLHRWLGLCDQPERAWDVIVFNFGHADATLKKAAYQDQLEKCILQLQKTNAKLIWANSTPVPYGFNAPDLAVSEFIAKPERADFEYEHANPSSLLPGRMRLQNQWAKETIRRFGRIEIVDLWNVVFTDADGQFGEWWFGKSTNFRQTQTKPIANALAKAIKLVTR